MFDAVRRPDPAGRHARRLRRRPGRRPRSSPGPATGGSPSAATGTPSRPTPCCSSSRPAGAGARVGPGSAATRWCCGWRCPASTWRSTRWVPRWPRVELGAHRDCLTEGLAGVRRGAAAVRVQGPRAAASRCTTTTPTTPPRSSRHAAGGPGGRRRAAGSSSPSSRTSTPGRGRSPAPSAPRWAWPTRSWCSTSTAPGRTPSRASAGALVADAVPLPPEQVHYVPRWAEVPAVLAGIARPGDLVLTMGAGDVTVLGPEVLRELDGRPAPRGRTRDRAGGDGRERRTAGRAVTPPARRPASGRRGRVRGGDDVGSDWERAGRGRAAREGARPQPSGERAKPKDAPRRQARHAHGPGPADAVPPGAVPVPRRPEQAPGRRPPRGRPPASGRRARGPLPAPAAGRGAGRRRRAARRRGPRHARAALRRGPRERRGPHGHRADHRSRAGRPRRRGRDPRRSAHLRGHGGHRVPGRGPGGRRLRGGAAGVAAHRRGRGHRARPGRAVADPGGPVRGRHHRAVVPPRARPAARAAPPGLRRRRRRRTPPRPRRSPCSATSPSRCAPRWRTVAVAGTQVTLGLVDDRSVRWGDPERSADKIAVLGPLLGQPGSVYDVSSPDLPTVRP